MGGRDAQATSSSANQSCGFDYQLDNGWCSIAVDLVKVAQCKWSRLGKALVRPMTRNLPILFRGLDAGGT